MPWHLRKTTKGIFSLFFCFLNVDVCDAEEYESCRMWTLYDVLFRVMSERRSNHLLAGVSHRQYYISLHKKKTKNKNKNPERNLFNKVCIRATSGGLWADAGRPEFSHRGKVINMRYIDVVLSVIGLWEIISTLHAASDAAVSLFLSHRRSRLYIFLIKVSLLVLQNMQMFPPLQPSAILWWHFAAASEMRRLLLSAHTWYLVYTVDLVIFMLLFHFSFGHWLCKSCSSLISVGLFFFLAYASKQGVARCCCVPGFAVHHGIKLHVCVNNELWKWGEIVIRTANVARDFKFWTDRKGIWIFLNFWHDITKNCLDATLCLVVFSNHSDLRSSSNKTCTLVSLVAIWWWHFAAKS